MASETVTHTILDPKPATYEEAYVECLLQINRVAEDLETITGEFNQLGALFSVIKRQLKEGRNIRCDELAEMGHFCADDWANSADLVRANLLEVVRELPSLPRREAKS